MKKIINGFFVGGIVAFLLLGFINTIFFPDEINDYENRYANKVEKFTAKKYIDGSFQTQLGDALNDQVTLSITMKRCYNYLNSQFEEKLLSSIIKENPNHYWSFKGGLIFNDFLVYGMRDSTEILEKCENKVVNIKDKAIEYPNIDFYVYYIEKDTDINFETNQKASTSSYLEKEFEKADISFNAFEVNSFDEFSKYFYKTDHHWNCYGSYRAYCEVLDLLEIEEEPVSIKEEYMLDYAFSGSKAVAIGASENITEKFPAYKYAYPEIQITIDGQIAEDYGKQESYFTSEMQSISYGMFYGYDNGEIIFDTLSEGKENLLVIGESYDNAILKLLASHHGRTHSIDLRNYEKTFGQSFSFSKYVKENNITKVLFIGNIDFFILDQFLVED